MTPPHRRMLMAAAAAVLLDVTSKVLSVRFLDQSVSLLPTLSLQLTYNSGVAFGVGRSLPAGVLLALTGLICLGVAVAGWRGSLGPPVAVGLVAGGAIANLADRLLGGSVVDMIRLTWWPTFNLADVAICLGIGGIVVSAVRDAWREKSNPALSEDSA
jgi:signal peptidase II